MLEITPFSYNGQKWISYIFIIVFNIHCTFKTLKLSMVIVLEPLDQSYNLDSNKMF